jgi:glycerophosphoryl diester phosphodiesterase
MPLWISHRGYQHDAVENTREAFRAAVEHGFTALETDLRLTSDEQIVLVHDPDLRRLCGLAERVERLTRKEIEAIELASGARFFFLDQFVREFAGTTWTFDVKPERGAETLRALARWAKDQALTDWVVAQARFLTWKPAHERLLRDLFPKAVSYARQSECWRAGLAVLAGRPAWGGLRRGRTYAVPAKWRGRSLFRPEIVAAYHGAGARALAFLPGSDAEARAAIDAGFDEILTDGRIVT